MPLSDLDFSMLQEMQSLCSRLEDDLKKIAAFKEYLDEVDARYRRLGDLYETQWQRLTESEALDPGQRKRIEERVPEGGYSIFWQDTVWNALSDVSIEYTQLLKSLAQKI